MAGVLPPPVVLPLAPLPLPGVPHVFTRCAPAGAEPEWDYLRVPTACAVFGAFPLLGWVDVSAAFPGHSAAPALSLLRVLGPPMHLDWGTPAANAALKMAELTTSLDLAAYARFADAQEGLGVLSKVYTSSRAHLDVLEVALVRCPVPSPFLIGAGELVTPSPFMSPGTPAVLAVAFVPAVVAVAAVAGVRAQRAVAGRAGQPPVAAVAAVPRVAAVAARAAIPAVVAAPAVPPTGPAVLEWLHLVKLGARVDQTSIYPFLAFLDLGAMMVDRCSRLARADALSLVCEVADSLRGGTLAHSRASVLGSAALARQFQAFSVALQLLPTALRTHAFQADLLGRELLDAISYTGEQALQDVVTSSRLHLIQREYPSAFDFLSRCAGQAEKVSAIRSLTPLGLGHRAGSSLFDCLDTFDALLLKHVAFLTQCWNKGLPVVEVSRLLKIEAAEWKDAGAADAVETPSGSTIGHAAVSLRNVTDAALRRAVLECDAFIQVAAEIAELDLETNDGRSSALEAALLSGLSIFQRFFANPGSLATKHVVFASLTLCLCELPAYLGRAQAAEPGTDEIPELRENWLFTAAQCDLLFKGRVSEIDWFGRSGALGLMNLDAAEPFLECPTDQMFIVEAVLEQIIPFVKATMIAAGWAAEATGGYTLVALFEKQLSHLKWIRKQGELEVGTLLPHAQRVFVEALLACDATHARMLAHPEPAEATLSWHLAFDGPYDRELRMKKVGVTPLINLRRAFPGLLPPSTPRSVAGVVLPEPVVAAKAQGSGKAKVGKGQDGGSGSGGGGGGKGEGGGGGKLAGADPKPGSLKMVVSWTDATHMRLGHTIYDTGAIADYYSLDKDHCFPVLLSTKQGNDKHALCAHWGEPGHTSATSEKHVRPKNFDLAYVEKHLATRAPQAEQGGAKKRKKPG